MSVSATPRQQRVREIDFRRPSKFSRDQVRRIEIAHETFAQTASSRLSAELRAEFHVGDATTDQLPYSVFMFEEAPDQPLIAVLDADPIDTQVALILDFKLVACLASRLLGGPVDAGDGETTALTSVELVVARRAIEAFVDVLSTTWNDLAGVTFTLSGTATSAMSAQLVPPSEPTLLLHVPTKLGDLESTITLVLPHRSLQPIADKLEHGAYGPDAIDASGAEMQDAVRGVDVELRAEVASVDIPLAEVLCMSEGDVIRLKRPAKEGIVLHVDEVPAYVAQPGRNGNLRAIQIREPWTRQP